MKPDLLKSELVEKQRRKLNPELDPKTPYEKLVERSKETKQKYHFEEMAEIEPAVIEVVQQLKDNIEKGEYDALMSDDAGGRIPTLILKKIFDKINSNKRIPTLFVAAGHSLPNRGSYDDLDFSHYDRGEDGLPTAEEVRVAKQKDESHQRLIDYLEEFKKGRDIGKVLVVTQFIRRGASMGALLETLGKVGLEADVASLEVQFEKDTKYFIPLGTKIYSAPNAKEARNYKTLKIAEEHEKLSGVEKNRTNSVYSPVPVVTRNRKTPLVYFDEWLTLKQKLDKIFYGDRYSDYYKEPMKRDEETEGKVREEMDRVLYRPITPEEVMEVKRDIRFARKDIDLLARKVVEQVWGK